MIAEISVENLAIIERSRIELGPGFTVLTGETGAGKSLLVDAIELALGERADSDLVRAGARSASVSVLFDFSEAPDVALRCQDLGFQLEEERLYISREVFAEGRSQSRIQGRSTPLSLLKGLGQYVVDLHGQHDHQSLLFPERHIKFLDLWIGQPATSLLDRVSESYGKVSVLLQRIEALRINLREREHRLDLLRHQIGEIQTVGPKEGEAEELEGKLSKLQHVERLANATQLAKAGLVEQESSAMDLLGAALKQLREVSRFDPDLESILVPLDEALYQLEEGVTAVSAYADSLEADPNILDETSTRLDDLRRLRRKYGDDETAVLSFLESAQAQLALLEDAEATADSLDHDLELCRGQLLSECKGLSELRQSQALQFSSLVQAQLQELALERAQFVVVFRDKAPTEIGTDDVEFYFSANAGEPPRPLSKIASGGEVSRLMLAIKTVLAGTAGVPTLIFDEVDSGLGGRVAATLGRKLKELAKKYQVLVISHLPQVAARADTHFKIEKVESQGRVVTTVRRLNGEERVEEVARMLAGEILTQAALENARTLLEASN